MCLSSIPLTPGSKDFRMKGCSRCSMVNCKIMYHTTQVGFSSHNGKVSTELGCSTVGLSINGNGGRSRHRGVISSQLIVKVGLPPIAPALAAGSNWGGNVQHPLIDGSRSVGMMAIY